MPPHATPTQAKRPSRRRKILAGLAIGLLVLIVVAFFAVPPIASSIVPGIIADAAGVRIAGSVRVASVRVGWWGPTKITGLSLADPAGAPVATLDITNTHGLFSLLTSNMNLGQTEVSGKADLVLTTNADGSVTSNLQQATAPQLPQPGVTPIPGAPSGPLALPKGLRAGIKITGIDVTLVEIDAAGQVTARSAMTGLKGDAALDGATLPATASADIRADFAQGMGQAKTGTLVLKLAGRDLTDAAGVLQVDKSTLDVNLTLAGAPTKLLDTLARQNGLLVGLLGDRIDAVVLAQVAAAKADADIKLDAPNTKADLALTRDAGRLKLTRPGTLTIASLSFLQRIPAVRSALADAGMTIDHAGWPGVTLAIGALDLPADPAATWAGAQVEIAGTLGLCTGRLTTPGASQPEAFTLQPIALALKAQDLAKGASITASGKATIAGTPAGDFNAQASLTGLLGSGGRLVLLDGKLPGSVAAQFNAVGIATTLLQPIASASGLPVVLSQDIGPTIDATLTARTAEGAPKTGVQNTGIDFALRSANLTASGSLLLSPTLLSQAPAVPIVLEIQRGGALLARLVNAPPTPGKTEIAITGGVRMGASITDLAIPMPSGKPDAAAVRFKATASMQDAQVALPTAQPITLGTTALDATIDYNPGAPVAVSLRGPLTIDGQSAALDVQLQVEGLGTPARAPVVPIFGPRRVVGSVLLTGLPAGAVHKGVLSAQSSQAARDLLAEVLGPAMDIRLTFVRPAGAGGSGGGADAQGQSITLAITGPNVQAATGVLLTAGELAVDASSLSATLSPGSAKAALGLIGQSDAAVGGVSLRENAQVVLRAAPIRLPIKVGTAKPDWSGVGDRQATAELSISAPVIADNVSVAGHSRSFGLAGVRGTLAVPLAMLGPSAGKEGAPRPRPVQASLHAELIGSSTADVLARLDWQLNADAQTGHTDARLGVTEVATKKLDDLLGNPGMLSGALGPRAAITLAGKRASQSEPLSFTASATSDRLKADDIRIRITDEALILAQPMTLNWEIDPNWARVYLLQGEGTTGGAGGGVGVEGVTKLRAAVRSLALAWPQKDASGAATAGPFKPGIFALDASLSLPSVKLRLPDRPGPIELQEIDAAVKASAGNQPGITLTASIAKIKDGNQTTTQPTTLNASASNLADARGVLQTDAATLSMQLQTGMIPSSFVDALTGNNGQIEQFAGKELSIRIDVRNLSMHAGGGLATLRVNSPNATLALGGPVANGTLDTTAPGGTPLRLEVNELRFVTSANLGTLSRLNPLEYLGFAAGVERLRGNDNQGPMVISSTGLLLPLNGDWSRLNGQINVDLGRVNFKLDQNFLQLLDIDALNKAIDKLSNARQRPVPPFTIALTNGTATYKDVQLPVGSYDFRATGTINLAAKEMDVITYVPTISLAPSVLSSISDKLTTALGRVIPGNIAAALMVPIRTTGPFGQTKTSVDLKLMASEAGSQLLKPENVINAIGGLFGGDKNKDKKNPPK